MGVAQGPVPEHDPISRARSFDVVELGYSQENALTEARRCIRCDLWRLAGIPSVWPRGKKAV